MAQQSVGEFVHTKRMGFFYLLLVLILAACLEKKDGSDSQLQGYSTGNQSESSGQDKVGQKPLVQPQTNISECEALERKIILDRTAFYAQLGKCLNIPDFVALQKQVRELTQFTYEDQAIKNEYKDKYGELAKCFEASFGSCTQCSHRNSLKSCTSCLKSVLGKNCFQVQGSTLDWLPAYPADCVEAGVIGLGVAFDELVAQSDPNRGGDKSYNVYGCRWVIDEMRQDGGCNGGSRMAWSGIVEPKTTCLNACNNTLSCRIKHKGGNTSEKNRCTTCLNACKQDPNFCKKIANYWRY